MSASSLATVEPVPDVGARRPPGHEEPHLCRSPGTLAPDVAEPLNGGERPSPQREDILPCCAEDATLRTRAGSNGRMALAPVEYMNPGPEVRPYARWKTHLFSIYYLLVPIVTLQSRLSAGWRSTRVSLPHSSTGEFTCPVQDYCCWGCPLGWFITPLALWNVVIARRFFRLAGAS